MKENSTQKNITLKKKLILILAPVCLLVTAGVIVTAVALSRDKVNIGGDIGGSGIEEEIPSGNLGGENGGGSVDEPKEDDEPVSGQALVFANPVDGMNVAHTFGFYYNSTLDSYYEHKGIDVLAEVGDEVYATTGGKISAIYLDDVLLGGQIHLNNGEGIITVYNFVDPVEGLKVGDEVEKGEVIATVSAPTGSEYKDGAHVHVEVYLNGNAVDPENYLSGGEK